MDTQTLTILNQSKQESKIDKFYNLLNKIHLQDCAIGMSELPDKSIDLLIADPPYGISRELNVKGKRLGTSAILDFNFGEWDKFNKKWIEIAIPKVKGWFVSFCAKKDLGIYWTALEQNGFIAVDAIAWQKPDPLPLNAKTRFVNAWEVAVIGKRPGGTWNSKYEHNVIKFQAPKGKDRIHPTQKPLGLIRKLVELMTNKDDIVLDPFMGSGTTAVACQEIGRNFIGYEIDESFYSQANERIKNAQRSLF